MELVIVSILSDIFIDFIFSYELFFDDGGDVKHLKENQQLSAE